MKVSMLQKRYEKAIKLAEEFIKDAKEFVNCSEDWEETLAGTANSTKALMDSLKEIK